MRRSTLELAGDGPVMELCVSAEQEFEGLDCGEHGMHACDRGLGVGALEGGGASARLTPTMAARLATNENA